MSTKKLRILDLFSGLGGEERRETIESRGHLYYTVDFNDEFRCDLYADIGNLTPNDLGRDWDFIWASPPCESFSVSSIGHHWFKDNTPKTVQAEMSVKLVRHLLWLIRSIDPPAWIIENPRGKLRKLPFMLDLPRRTVTYCQYGEDRMKPTDLWGVVPGWVSRPMCKNGDPCHVSAPRGSRTGTQGMKSYAIKSVVPLQLWKEILDALERR